MYLKCKNQQEEKSIKCFKSQNKNKTQLFPGNWCIENFFFKEENAN